MVYVSQRFVYFIMLIFILSNGLISVFGETVIMNDNSSFEVWEIGKPVSWELDYEESEFAVSITQSNSPKSGNVALNFKADAIGSRAIIQLYQILDVTSNFTYAIKAYVAGLWGPNTQYIYKWVWYDELGNEISKSQGGELIITEEFNQESYMSSTYNARSPIQASSRSIEYKFFS